MSWFIDGVGDGWSSDVVNRYNGLSGSTCFSADAGAIANMEDTGIKAIWYGLVLAYDANHGTGEHQYDAMAYHSGTTTATASNMFTYAGYSFVGWNTEADGSGLWYYPQFNGYNMLHLNNSLVLYAQWVRDVGSLCVSKTVSGDAADETLSFPFTVTLADGSVNGLYGAMTFIDGVASFELKHGESISANNLPAGIGYEVSETDSAGYRVSVNSVDTDSLEGSIIAGETVTAAFNNAKINGGGQENPAPAKVTLTAQKTLDGAAPLGSDFTFLLKNSAGDVIQSKSNMGGTVSFDELSFTEIGEYRYTISEQAGNAQNILYDKAVFTAIIIITQNENGLVASIEWQKDGAPYDGTPVFANVKRSTENPDPDKPDPDPDKPGPNPDKPGPNPDKPGPNPDRPGHNPDRPGQPDEPGTPSKPGNLAQTGMLWWPVPIMAGVGVLVLLIGWSRRRKRNESNDE